jgi:pilus assembly protein CpaC
VSARSGFTRRRARLTAALAGCALVFLLAGSVSAQRIVSKPEKVLLLAKGASLLLENQVPIQRFSIGDPAVAEATVLSPVEVLVSGKALGVTSLLVWGNDGQVRLYSVEVAADAPGLERYLDAVLPGEKISVSATGNSVTLSGQVRDASVSARAVEIAKGTGAVVIDNLSIPTATQVMLKVRFAEVSRSALEEWSSRLATLNPHELSDNGDWAGTTNSDGNVTFNLSSPGASLSAAIRWLKGRGDFKDLAEPNLLALPGKEASFLAGGEFPYPTVQSGGVGGIGSNAVTITFREFGIKLIFTPTIMRNGNIRLKLEAEVSALDFANALTFEGFVVPSLLTRRAATEVELQDGQFLSIAGLLDNTTLKNVNKIPILGDIPILGEFFKSKSARERRTELLVVVSPDLVQAQSEAEPVPTGEPSTWDWSRRMQAPPEQDNRGSRPSRGAVPRQ